jgi:hypothetical protein
VSVYVYTYSGLEQIREEPIVAYFRTLTVCLPKNSEMGGACGSMGDERAWYGASMVKSEETTWKN